MQEVNAQLQREKEAEVQMRQAARSAEQASGGGGAGGKGWNEEDLQLLIKAVNLFPAGTNARYTLTQCLQKQLQRLQTMCSGTVFSVGHLCFSSTKGQHTMTVVVFVKWKKIDLKCKNTCKLKHILCRN